MKSGSRNIYEDPSVRDPSYPYDRNNSGRGVFGYNATLENRIVDLKELSSPGSLPVLASSQGDVGGLRLAKEGPSPIAKRFGYSGSTTPLGPAPNYGGRAVFLFADWRVESRDICRSDQWPWDDPQAFYPN